MENMELPRTTKHFQISNGFAQRHNITNNFIGKILIETTKAVYIYGKCSTAATIVDNWFPKMCIRKISDSEEEIHIPEEHIKKTSIAPPRQAIYIDCPETGRPLIKITFPFNQKDITNIKTLPNRIYHGNEIIRYWTCPCNTQTIEALQFWGFPLDSFLTEFLQKGKKQLDPQNTPPIKIPGLKMRLFPFQKHGVSFIESRKGRALLGDEMGLGKTAQALAWLQLHPNKRPAIIICPANVKLNWANEIAMWMPKPKVRILFGTPSNETITEDIIIINYDILHKWGKKLEELRPSVLIIDECHYIKNNSALRTKTCKRLGKRTPHIIGLSGTPFINRPIELYNILKLIDDTVVGNFFEYAKRYCGAYQGAFGWDFSGATNTEELHQILTQTVMLRRLKKDVLQELPPKTRTVIPIELDNKKEYAKASKDLITWVNKHMGQTASENASTAEALVEIEVLKQLAVKGKMKQAIEWIRNFLETNGKLVLFGVHKTTIDKLMQEFGNVAVKIDGSVPLPERQIAIDRFQNEDSTRLFIGNIKAAGIGITLTAASNVAFLELGWTPGEHDQAEDRIHRIGQTATSINAYYLIAANTIEEKIIRLIDKKRKVIDVVLDGKKTETASLFSELMDSLTSKKENK